MHDKCKAKKFIQLPFFEIKKYFGLGQREKRIHELDHKIQSISSKTIRNKTRKAAPEEVDLFDQFIAYAGKSNTRVKKGVLNDLAMNILIAGKSVFDSPS